MPNVIPLWALSSSGTGVLHRIAMYDGAPRTDNDGLLWRALCQVSTEPESADAMRDTAPVCSVCAGVELAVA